MENNVTRTGASGLLEKGLDVLKDPKSSKGAKAGAVALVSVAAIGVIASKTLDIIKAD